MKRTPTRPKLHQSHNATSLPFHSRVGARAAIAVGLADVHGAPDAGAELVTQARLWTPAVCLEVAPGWVRIQLPDYAGWVRTTELGTPGRATRNVAVVVDEYVPIYAHPAHPITRPVDDISGYSARDIGVALDVAWVGTVLPLATAQMPARGERIAVRLPGNRTGWVKRSAVASRPRQRPFPPLGAGATLTVAFAMLGVPYLWGGTTRRGVDCSGLAQLSWRMGGATIPRDADQQFAALPYIVERGDLQPGDLLFFAARGRIDHVAIAVEGERFIHASGSAGRVTLNSLDAAAEDYSARLAQMYAGARRPIPDVFENFPPQRQETW